MPRVGQRVLNVVHLGFQPSEIYALSFRELAYFSECNDIIQKAYDDSIRRANQRR